MMSVFYNGLKAKESLPLLYSVICIITLLLFQPAGLRAEDSPVSATLTPHTFSTQQSARLAVTIQGKQDAPDYHAGSQRTHLSPARSEQDRKSTV